MEQRDIPVVIFFNKVDLIDSDVQDEEESEEEDTKPRYKKKRDKAAFVPEIHSDHPEMIPERRCTAPQARFLSACP